MATIPDEQDAVGTALLDYWEGRAVQPLILETDDNTSMMAMEPAWFFRTSDMWHAWEKRALDSLEGPILDLGRRGPGISIFTGDGLWM